MRPCAAPSLRPIAFAAEFVILLLLVLLLLPLLVILLLQSIGMSTAQSTHRCGDGGEGRGDRAAQGAAGQPLMAELLACKIDGTCVQ